MIFFNQKEHFTAGRHILQLTHSRGTFYNQHNPTSTPPLLYSNCGLFVTHPGSTFYNQEELFTTRRQMQIRADLGSDEESSGEVVEEEDV